jgi:predicted transcriptional regulator
MTTSEYAEKIAELIHERPRGVNADKLLYEVYVKFKIAEGLRAVKDGRIYTHEEVVEDMWKIINSKSSGASRQNGTSRKSSPKSRKTRR